MSIKQNIPNAITAGNLFCGCAAIVSISNGHFKTAGILVIIAAILDFLDGFAARILKVHSDIGKQLDSLADVVTFGVVPGYLLFSMLSKTVFCADGTCWKAAIMPYYGFIVTVFSAVRLAKFNVDTRQTNSFIGVPTPANALMIASITLMPAGNLFEPLLNNHYFLVGLTLTMSYLLVAEIPLFALKFKNYGIKGNEIRYSFLLICIVLLLVMGFSAAPFLLLLYILFSMVSNHFNKENKN